MAQRITRERRRLIDSAERRADWKHWGPYVSERAWGTVREDYSADGDAWGYFPHEHARSRAYRWNEDGLGGFCNRFQNICIAVALWNERDPCLKERLFGVSGPEGNHGEDVKEIYFYLDGVPSHTYMKMLYRYPQVEFPYRQLVEESQRRNYNDPEYELLDCLRETFEQRRYFDVFIEYAKAAQEDILLRVTAVNRGPDTAPLHVLPHVWYRNTWSWDHRRPSFQFQAQDNGAVVTRHRHLGERFGYFELDGDSSLLFTENETNNQLLFDQPNRTPYVKDGIHRAVVSGEQGCVHESEGSKVAAHHRSVLRPGERAVARFRFTDSPLVEPFDGFDEMVQLRRHEADEFYSGLAAEDLSDEEKSVQRQAFAGLLWSKQFYHYGVDLWLDGDPSTPKPPAERKQGRNAGWRHLYNVAVISMPDKWEYPWYAAWDLAFHTLPLAMIDPEWAKRQLILLLREWYMHPNGQLPAYEWNFGDVNPPVHAWAAWRVYKIDRNVTGRADPEFLERVFHKLLLNFTWWVNRKDADGQNVFQGGFLGLDNIGVFDRSAPLPGDVHLEQSDGTAWMGMFCLNMLAIALELARTIPAYEDVATKFFEHFIYIADAINGSANHPGLWDEDAGFYYDQLHVSGQPQIPLKIDSFVGLIPLYAVETLEPDILEKLPRFRRRMEWFIEYRPHLVERIASLTRPGEGGRLLLSMAGSEQIKRILQRMLDETQFLSPYGVRSLSRRHADEPFELSMGGELHTVRYDPAESTSGMFGGNSNWRGPVWFPLNHLMIESLQKLHHYYGLPFRVEMPTGSGIHYDLGQVARQLSQRLCRLFLLNNEGRRPIDGNDPLFKEPEWSGYHWFHEYFNGDTGAGLGASHQTGWTALIAKLLQSTAG